jgi:hypothetical protein
MHSLSSSLSLSTSLSLARARAFSLSLALSTRPARRPGGQQIDLGFRNLRPKGGTSHGGGGREREREKFMTERECVFIEGCAVFKERLGDWDGQREV